nr:hypothetical protein [Mycobacterium lepromatosis]
MALIATSTHPDQLNTLLRDSELSWALPGVPTRRALLETLLDSAVAGERNLDEIRLRTMGFVVADLAALVHKAAWRGSTDGQPLPKLDQVRSGQGAQGDPGPCPAQPIMS